MVTKINEIMFAAKRGISDIIEPYTIIFRLKSLVINLSQFLTPVYDNILKITVCFLYNSQYYPY